MSNRYWVLNHNSHCLSVGVTAADWSNITQSLQPLKTDSEWLHLDVMDGQFCSKLTIGGWAIKALPKQFIVDAHVMTMSPLTQAIELAKCGAHIVTLQYEALNNAVDAFSSLSAIEVEYQDRSLPLIRGVSLCPDTDVEVLEVLLPHIEVIQLLTLDPRTGEKMNSDLFISKLASLIDRLKHSAYKPLISVDGSMSLDIAKASINEGANIIVSGSALFKENALSDNLMHWRSHLFS